MHSRPRLEPLIVGAAAVFAVGLFLRLGYLGADPTYPFWSGWLTDEGRWTELAREWALFRAPDMDTQIGRTHLVLGPLYQVASALLFGLLGAGPVQARLVSVLAGVGILLVAGRFLWRRLGWRAAFATVALLGIQPDLVAFSRVAIPEMLALFFEFVAFCLLVGGPRTLRRAVLGGVVTAVALGVKGTTAPIVPVFALVLCIVHRPSDPVSRRIRVAGFLGAIAVPAVLFVVAYGMWTGGIATLVAGGGGMLDILTFVQLKSPYAAASTLFGSPWAVRINLLLAPAWGLGILLLLRGFPETETRAVFLGAVTWAVGWLVPWVTLAYFPERYVAHIHLPLVVALVAGLVALHEAGRTDLGQALGGLTPRRRGIVAMLLALPLASALAPAALAIVGLVASPLLNLRFHIAAMAALTLLLGWVALRRWTPHRAVSLGVAGPLAVALAWQVGRRLGWVPWEFWGLEAPAVALGWGVTLLAAGAAVGLARARPGEMHAHRAARVASIYLGLSAVLWTVDGLGRQFRRTYVLADVAESLTERFPDRLVGVRGGTSALLGTDLRYRELFSDDDAETDVVLTFEGEASWEALSDHRLIEEFPVDFGPRYYVDPPLDRLRIYLRGGEAGATSTEVTPENP